MNDDSTNNGEAMLDLARCSPLQVRALRRIQRLIGPDWRVFLWYLESEITNYKVADLFGLRVFQVRLFRQVLTYDCRQLVEGLSPLRAASPLVLISSKEESWEMPHERPKIAKLT